MEPRRHTLSADGGSALHIAEYGNGHGVPAVLLPGFRAPASSWRHQIFPLVDAGYRVFAIDIRGHGDASPNQPGTTMARRAADLESVMAGLHLHDAVAIGGSMVGNTLWAYLQAYGPARLKRIVIVDQTPKMLGTRDWGYGFYGYDEATRDTHFASGVPDTGHRAPLWRRPLRTARVLQALAGARRQPMTAGDLDLLSDHARADWRSVIAANALPVLFAAGLDSELWPADHGRASAELAPKGDFAVIPHAGHALNMEQPRAFNTVLLRWLAAHR